MNAIDFRIINNYAEALFNISNNLSIQNNIQEQLLYLCNSIKYSYTIRLFFYSPTIDHNIKTHFINLIAEKFEFDDTTRTFLLLIVENSRFQYLEKIVERFRTLIFDSQNIKNVVISSYSNINKEDLFAIEKLIKEKINTKVNIMKELDSSLIGGVVIKYDSVVIDCSIKGALNKVKKILTNGRIS